MKKKAEKLAKKTELKLTKRQLEFAGEHIGIVFGFLKEQGLEFNEYYDEVIFRYLRSIKNYLTRKDLRQ